MKILELPSSQETLKQSQMSLNHSLVRMVLKTDEEMTSNMITPKEVRKTKLRK